MRCALLSCLTACSFQSRASTSPAPEPDANDANTVCHVGAASVTGTERGKVGLSTGGGNVRPLACDGDARIVGLALDMSDQPVNGQDTDSARGIQLGCAAVTIDASDGRTGPVTMKTIEGNGGAGFSPSTMTALALCPAGAVLSGLAVHGSAHVNLFLDATMTCSAFDMTGRLTGTTAVYIAGSLTDTQNPSEAQCAPGEQVVSMSTDTGAGLDSLLLSCAPVTCD
jgi:hypothetical protein